MAYYSTKHYGHNIGLSAVFRQPNADHSHCHLLHGYSLAFTFTFGCNELDNKNWAVDFGGLKPLKAWLPRANVQWAGSLGLSSIL